jgi:hypothetical protein
MQPIGQAAGEAERPNGLQAKASSRRQDACARTVPADAPLEEQDIPVGEPPLDQRAIVKHAAAPVQQASLKSAPLLCQSHQKDHQRRHG